MLPDNAEFEIDLDGDLIFAARPELGVAIRGVDGRLYHRCGRQPILNREFRYLCADIDGICIAFLPNGFIMADHKLRTRSPKIVNGIGLIPYPVEGKPTGMIGWINNVAVYGDRHRLFIGRREEVERLAA